MEVSWFVTDSVVRGHHVYKDIHQGLVKLYNVCGNREDRFAVAVYKDQDTVGHVPRSISTQYIDYSISRSISVTCTQ